MLDKPAFPRWTVYPPVRVQSSGLDGCCEGRFALGNACSSGKSHVISTETMFVTRFVHALA
jgi:hypothetical protein